MRALVFSTVLAVISQITDRWNWLGNLSFLIAYKPQSMVASPNAAWSLLAYRNGSVAGLGIGGQVVVLITLGVACYLAGAVVFSRRDIPAPL